MNLLTRIESVMQDDAHGGPGWLRAGLSAAAGLYRAGIRLRKTAYANGWIKTARLDCRVVSVGNLTLGGTGKTPMTIYLARLIQSYGYRVAVISRGYKGSAEAQGGVVSDGTGLLMPASACGDEAYMMARALADIPVLVGRDRYTIGRTAIAKFDPEVLLLDDAFQHIRLVRDIDLVLLDAEKPFGNGKLFPRGVLREEKTALQRSSAVVLTRADQTGTAAAVKIERALEGKPLFQCVHQPYIADVISGKKRHASQIRKTTDHPGLKGLKGRRGYVFSGIADNTRFHRTIEQSGVHICGTSQFGDHHTYSEAELKHIVKSAEESGAELIMTTEKDYSRIPLDVKWPSDLVVVGVKIQFWDGAFDRFILEQLKLKRIQG